MHIVLGVSKLRFENIVEQTDLSFWSYSLVLSTYLFFFLWGGGVIKRGLIVYQTYDLTNNNCYKVS